MAKLSAALRIAELSQTAPNPFSLRPDQKTLDALAAELGFSALRKVNFEGAITASGGEDWALDALLGATVVQPCVVTNDPVTTRVDAPVRRVYLRHYKAPEEPEAEMPEDDSIEPLGQEIDPAVVLIEALALAAPEYPRKEGVELGEAVFAEPGAKAMTDDDAKPFAGLAALKAKLDDSGNADDK